MIAEADIVAVLRPFLLTFGTKLDPGQWEQYALALADVNPGDLDDALADLRKSHAFRNAPLPAEILDRCHVHRKRRQTAELPVTKFIKADPSEGEWKTFTLHGVSMRMHVLPDDHPALRRYACLACKDTGWEERPDLNPGKQPTYQRCGCVARNPVVQQARTRNATRAKERTR